MPVAEFSCHFLSFSHDCNVRHDPDFLKGGSGFYDQIFQGGSIQHRSDHREYDLTITRKNENSGLLR